MVKIVATGRFDISEGVGLVTGPDIESAAVDQGTQLVIGGITRTVDVIRIGLEGGSRVLLAGQNFAVNGSTSFEGPLDADDRISGGTVTAIHGQRPNGSVYARIEGLSATAAEVAQAALSDSTADEIAILRRELAGADSFELSQFGDLARGFGGNDLLRGRGGNDRLYGDEGNDTVEGGSGGDQLFGGAGNDRLVAGTGGDVLTGGLGRDVLVGGTETGPDLFVYDTFVFKWAGESRAVDRGAAGLEDDADTIVNFTRGNPSGMFRDGDLIVLEGVDTSSAAGDQDFRWGGKDGAGAGRLWWTDARSGILVLGDATGDGKSDLAIFLRGLDAITAYSFDL